MRNGWCPLVAGDLAVGPVFLGFDRFLEGSLVSTVVFKGEWIGF